MAELNSFPSSQSDYVESDSRVIAPIQLKEIELITPNPGAFADWMQWRIQLEALEEFPAPISVAFYWLGSASSDAHDQLLDEFEIGPLTLGLNEALVEHPPPEIRLIPAAELFEITGMYIIFGYCGSTFLRVGYWARIAPWDDLHRDNPPAEVNLTLLGRNINMARPLVNTYKIDWDKSTAADDDDHSVQYDANGLSHQVVGRI